MKYLLSFLLLLTLSTPAHAGGTHIDSFVTSEFFCISADAVSMVQNIVAQKHLDPQQVSVKLDTLIDYGYCNLLSIPLLLRSGEHVTTFVDFENDVIDVHTTRLDDKEIYIFINSGKRIAHNPR